MPLRKLVAGNWKMNGLAASAAVASEIAAAHPDPACDILICPPATLIARLAGMGLPVGGQDCHWLESGAHTGDISAEMLADAGAVAVILGHSERRADHGETDEIVARKARAAWRAGLAAIVCVGETEAERDAGRTLERIGAQLDGSIPDGATPASLVVAYEPVWAIGSGRTPSLAEIAEAHGFIRGRLAARFGQPAADGVRLLYGGSVKPGNAAEIFAVDDVDGALVGGASLKAADFAPIVAAAESSGGVEA
jgi:triosephosphate isomerase